MGLIIFIPLILVMYFMMIRPQQQRLKQQRAMLEQIDIGDDVVTESGIYGTVSDVDGPTVFLMVADGVEIKLAKSKIEAIIEYDEFADEPDADAVDDA